MYQHKKGSFGGMEISGRENIIGSDAHTEIKIKIPVIRNRYLFIVDVLMIILGQFFSANIVDGVNGSFSFLLDNWGGVLFTLAAFIIIMYIFGVYSIMWRYGSTRDYGRIITAGVLASAVSFIANMIFWRNLHVRFNILNIFVLTGMLTSFRMLVRAIYKLYNEKSATGTNRKKLMIIGAGTAAAIISKDITANKNLDYDLKCFIDDDPSKKNASLNGVKVLGGRQSIIRLAKTLKIDEILIAIPSAESSDRKSIIEICNQTGCKVKIFPGLEKMIDGDGAYKTVRNVQIEDLLERDPIKLDNSGIREYIENKVILVTGGGGSIGSELCRQIMKYNPQKLVILDIYENNAYDLQMELNRKYPENKPEVVIASVRDIDRLEHIFEEYKPYIVFHAAAHKHVPLMEDSPGEAIKNNVFGTLNVAKCADKYGVKRFVMISTDKAVNPTNIMGATKRICEMIVQAMQEKSKTEFVAVRFGNVLGSNGSVIPLFKRQIEEGGPITITHKEITRFFMTIPEAAQLVLQAASYANGGEIFVLDMGKPVKIYDLAVNLIRLSGYTPDVDIKIEVCGLRPGEKLYEELLMDEEGLTDTRHNKIFIGKQIDINREELKMLLDELWEAADSGNKEKIVDAVAHAVPTYVRKQKVVKAG